MSFGEFGKYFSNKIKKLQESANVSKNLFDHTSSIFKNCYFIVNGETDPPIDELRRILTVHGGVCENYPVPRVTHHVCDYFTEAQVKHMNKIRKLPTSAPSQLKYVTVEWVKDSIRLNRRQPEMLYLPDGMKRDKHGQQIEGFFQTTKIPCSSSDVSSSSIAQMDDGHMVGSDGYPVSLKAVANPEDKQSSFNVTHSPTSSSSSSNGMGGQEPLTSLTSEHHDFLNQYLKNSRLSFIGRWRSRVPVIASKFGKLNLKSSQPASSSHGIHNLFVANATIAPNCSQSVIVHVDMDCFFVSALLRHRPELNDKPVAIAHGSSATGFSEISSCNYVARQFGVKNGMFMSTAKPMCPHLIVLPYNFPLYEELGEKIYSIYYTSPATMVEPVSVDEVYLEFECNHSQSLAHIESIVLDIRHRIFEVTEGCTASAGIADNPLLARLATKKAKSNGQFCLLVESPVNLVDVSGDGSSDIAKRLSGNKVDDDDDDCDHDEIPLCSPSFRVDADIRVPGCISNNASIKPFHQNKALIHELLNHLPIADLPGVGYKMKSKLTERSLHLCADIWKYTAAQLQEWYGSSMSKLLYESSRGIDTRSLVAMEPCKSISLDVNWGLRFSSKARAEHFIATQLCPALADRLAYSHKKGRTIVVKLMVREKSATDPIKFLGHGVCDSFSKSVTLSQAVYNSKDIAAHALQLFRGLTSTTPAEDLRGMGISITKLCAHDSTADRKRPSAHSTDEASRKLTNEHRLEGAEAEILVIDDDSQEIDHGDNSTESFLDQLHFPTVEARDMTSSSSSSSSSSVIRDHLETHMAALGRMDDELWTLPREQELVLLAHFSSSNSMNKDDGGHDNSFLDAMPPELKSEVRLQYQLKHDATLSKAGYSSSSSIAGDMLLSAADSNEMLPTTVDDRVVTVEDEDEEVQVILDTADADRSRGEGALFRPPPPIKSSTFSRPKKPTAATSAAINSKTLKQKPQQIAISTASNTSSVNRNQPLPIAVCLQLQGLEEDCLRNVPRDLLMDHVKETMKRKHDSVSANINDYDANGSDDSDVILIADCDSRSRSKLNLSVHDFQASSTAAASVSCIQQEARDDICVLRQSSLNNRSLHPFVLEDLVTLNRGLRKWLVTLSGLQSDSLLTALRAPSKEECEYVCEYGEWLVYNEFLDRAASFVRLVSRIVRHDIIGPLQEQALNRYGWVNAGDDDNTGDFELGNSSSSQQVGSQIASELMQHASQSESQNSQISLFTAVQAAISQESRSTGSQRVAASDTAIARSTFDFSVDKPVHEIIKRNMVHYISVWKSFVRTLKTRVNSEVFSIHKCALCEM